MLTEQQNPNTHQLDKMDTSSILRLMNDEDKTVAFAVEKAIPQIAMAVDAIRNRLADGGRLLYIGAGTSGRLGVLDAVECVPTFGTSPDLVKGIIAGGDGAFVQAVEGAEDDTEQGKFDLINLALTAKDAVVGVAASGRTPYTLGAIEYAKSIGAITVGVSCNDPAPLLDAVDIAIGVVVGAEVLTGSTRLKAGTAQKLVLNMISTATFVQLGKVYGNLMVDVQITNEKLELRAQRIVQEITGVDNNTAVSLLKQAKNNAKVAIVMHLQDVDCEQATSLLTQSNGNLRAVIHSTERNS